jgi:hypothetical protein
MKHTAAAIREAADRGGYGYRWWKVHDIEDGVGCNALPMRALTEHLYDPAFWEALGKARNWQNTGAWLVHWHRFIDLHPARTVRVSFQTCRERWPSRSGHRRCEELHG